jgi:hypothetical protein
VRAIYHDHEKGPDNQDQTCVLIICEPLAQVDQGWLRSEVDEPDGRRPWERVPVSRRFLTGQEWSIGNIQIEAVDRHQQPLLPERAAAIFALLRSSGSRSAAA